MLWNNLMIFFIMCIILGIFGLILLLDEKINKDEDEEDEES